MRTLFTILFFVSSIGLKANHPIDSLRLALGTAPDDEKVGLYYQLANVSEETSDDTAQIYLEQALKIAKPQNHKLLPDIYKLEGYIWYKKGELEKAKAIYLLALEGFKNQQRQLPQAQVYNNLAVIERNLGHIDEAESSYLAAGTIFSDLGAEVELANLYLNLCYFYSNLGNTAKADYYVGVAIEIGQTLNDLLILSKANKYLALKYLSANRFTEALDCHFRNVDLFMQTANYTELSYAYFGVATIYRELGQFDQVIKYLTASLELARETKSVNYEVKTLNEMGYVYNQWEKPELAIDLFYQAIGVEPNAEGMNKAHSLAGLGESYETLEVFNKAINYYDEALNIFEKLSYKAGLVQTYVHLANLYSESLNNFTKANYYFTKANLAANELDDFDLLAELWLVEANSLKKQQKYGEAVVFYQNVVASGQADFQALLASYTSLGEIFSKQKKYEASIANYQLALGYKDSVARQKQIVEYNSWLLKQNLHESSITAVAHRNNEPNNLKNQTNVLNIILISLLAVVSALLVGLWFANRKKLNKLRKSVERLTHELNQQKAQLADVNAGLMESKILTDKTNQFKAKFFANISHEIRTPLNAILGYAKLLARQNKDDINHKYAVNIISSSDSLQNLINNLLDFSKLESGQMRIEQQVFSPLSTITQIIADNKEKAAKKNIALELHFDPQMPEYVVGDPVRLVQIMDNVLDNAIKYSYEGKPVSIEVQYKEPIGDKVNLTFNITDNGIGIDSAKLDAVFTSYAKLEKTPNKNDGAGLGLAVTKGLVDLQKGNITVESQLDGPTIFRIEMQYQMASENYLKERKDLSVSAQKLDHVNILLVEDNIINRELAIDTIAFWGSKYSCDVAENGAEAVECLKQKSYHVILMDIQMPVMDGYTATRFIRTQMPHPICETPIIGITAFAFEKEKQEALQNGMNAYVTKPFDPQVLKQTVDHLLNKES